METDVEKIEEHGIQKQPLHISDICCIVFFHLCFGVLCGVMLIGLYYGLTSIRTEKPMGWDPRVDQAPILRFGYDGTFRISVFEDLHLGEGEANRKFHCSTDLVCMNSKVVEQHQSGAGGRHPTSKLSES
jgi:hypothetical protein